MIVHKTTKKPKTEIILKSKFYEKKIQECVVDENKAENLEVQLNF